MSINDPIYQGLAGLGHSLGQGIREYRHEQDQKRKEARLGALIESTNDAGDYGPGTLNKIAQLSPQMAQHLAQQEQAAKERVGTQIGQISRVALGMQNPRDARNFLLAQTKSASPRLRKEILETLELDDQQMMNDLQIAYEGASTMPSFGKITEGVDDQGNPVFFQAAKDGTVKQIEGFAPPVDPEKGYTLSPGQTRFDASGRPIASVQAAPEKGKGFDQEGKLRNEFTKFSKDFQTQNASFGRIQASANDPTAAGDLALIFNYMKLLDPGSTVREGEFDTAQGAFGALNKAEDDGAYVPNFIKRGVQQLMEGTRLLPAQRKDFYGRAQALFADAQEQHGRRASQYTNLANAYELDPSRVVIDLQTVDPDKQVNLGGDAEDQRALAWAKQNPNDPRAAEILNQFEGRQ